MKIKMYAKIILFLMIFASLTGAGAQENDLSDEKKDHWGIVPIAIPMYTPDTKFMAAGAVVYYNNPYPENPGQKPDEISVYAAYSQLHQASVGMNTERYYNGDKMKLFLEGEFSRWPDLFWGLGPNAKDSFEEEYSTTGFYIKGSFMWEVYKQLYIGPLYGFTYRAMKERTENGILAGNSIPGSDGTIVSGIGFHINWDTRDSSFYPHKGFWLEMKTGLNRKEFGSEYNFFSTLINCRYFFHLTGDHVIGVQTYMVFNAGTVPFESMAKMGGKFVMRGYRYGRYQDKNYMAAQAEYRFPIIWRFGGVFFGSVGQVAPALDEFRLKSIKADFGTGLRFNADRDEHINIRIDIGFDTELNPNFYLLIKEAF
ncbi:MAG: BamA/TamA family outer membrane protein [bacterium]|nr:BamA/TamA family outer membrane protein [bacterium]